MSVSDTTARLFGYLPPYYGVTIEDADPLVLRILEAIADELDRARALLEVLRDSSIPATADDRLGQLSRWERTLRLPVAMPGASDAQRQAKVVAAIISRRAASGAAWTDALTKAIGSPDWTPEENEPAAQQLRITIPYVAGGFSAGQVEALARRITPAHLDIVMRYSQGFIVGVSRVGDAI